MTDDETTDNGGMTDNGCEQLCDDTDIQQSVHVKAEYGKATMSAGQSRGNYIFLFI